MRRLLTVAFAGSLLGIIFSVTPGAIPAAACPVDFEYEPPAPTTSVAGAYHSAFGTVVLEQTGGRITGSFDCCGGGTIDGYMVGSSITYTWRQSGGAWGRGTWAAVEGKLTGSWGWEGSSSSGGAWDLVLPV